MVCLTSSTYGTGGGSEGLGTRLLSEPKMLLLVESREHKNKRRVRTRNFVKIETDRNLPPVLKIVTRTAHAA